MSVIGGTYHTQMAEILVNNVAGRFYAVRALAHSRDETIGIATANLAVFVCVVEKAFHWTRNIRVRELAENKRLGRIARELHFLRLSQGRYNHHHRRDQD